MQCATRIVTVTQANADTSDTDTDTSELITLSSCRSIFHVSFISAEWPLSACIFHIKFCNFAKRSYWRSLSNYVKIKYTCKCFFYVGQQCKVSPIWLKDLCVFFCWLLFDGEFKCRPSANGQTGWVRWRPLATIATSFRFAAAAFMRFPLSISLSRSLSTLIELCCTFEPEPWLHAWCVLLAACNSLYADVW